MRWRQGAQVNWNRYQQEWRQAVCRHRRSDGPDPTTATAAETVTTLVVVSHGIDITTTELAGDRLRR